MTKRKLVTAFESGRGYTKEDWDEVSDFPGSTDEELKQFRPFAEVFPELGESIRRSRGRPRSERPRQHVSLRLGADVLEKFRATGRGWQSRLNAVLEAAQV